MKNSIIFFFLTIINISTILVSCGNISLGTVDVEEGIYNLVLQKKSVLLSYYGSLRTSQKQYGYSRLNFKITYANNEGKKFFHIRHVYSGLYLGAKKDTIINNETYEYQIGANYNIIQNEDNVDNINYEWEFVKEDGKSNSFIIKNSLGCELTESEKTFVCSFKENGTSFSLLKLYQEKEKYMTEEDKKILEAEPIDVFIKYIDMSDPNLTRGNLSQIKKDKENDELKYCVRSVLKYIPWIRKIFILMPNEKVRFFKNYSEINKKIIYVHDKDILGHESANIHAFQFRIWKLKEFGLSDNFISMDDDYFIGRRMKKSDFFYVENKTVYPAIINTNFEIQTLSSAQNGIDERLLKMEKSKRIQTSDEFMYTVYRSYMFLIQYFDSPIIVPYFTHNAIPVNANDLKEVFDLIDNSTEFRYPTLYSLYRHPQSLQYQTMLVVYVFNKYRRKVNKIENNYIDAAYTITSKFDYPLFCINTGNNKDYSQFSFDKMKITMEKLFPIPTKYEIYESKTLADNAFYILKQLDNDIKKLDSNINTKQLSKERLEYQHISIKYETYKNQYEFLKAENLAYKSRIEKIISDMIQIKNESEIKEKKLNELEKLDNNYNLISSIKKELIFVNKEINNLERNIMKYKKQNEEYLDKINKAKNTENELYFIIFFQLIIIIAIIIGIVIVFYIQSKKEKKVEMLGYNRFT